MTSTLSPARRAFFMMALVIAGEAIFGLPFVVARVFRPTLLEVFGLSNLELGLAYSAYGVVAMLAYFPGGPLADHFSARKLMSVALWVTALGGLYFATIPAIGGLRLLYAFWGVSTILLFWAAMIRATREWGGQASQGMAFGLLDSGRGLFAAVLASFTVAVFASLLPEDAASSTLAEREAALRQVIWIVSLATGVSGFLTWFLVPENASQNDQQRQSILDLKGLRTVLSNPRIWLQGLIVITAYTGYKGVDDLGLYSKDVFAFDDVQAAQVGTLALWIRPFSALLAGFLGDRIGVYRALKFCFVAMIITDGVVALGLIQPSQPWMLFSIVVSTGTFVYGLRSLYFAIFEQSGVSYALTGTAAGIVSVVGFTPDIFMGPLMGYLTDTYPGSAGHGYFFAALAAFAVIGLFAVIASERHRADLA